MKQLFYKYQGTGNDFVMIDNRLGVFDKSNTQLIAHLCNRRTGVGADGLILLESQPSYDFKMVYFNADGNESTMCGNGGRCIVAFARFLEIIDGDTKFLAIDGPHKAHISEAYVELKMQDVSTITSTDNYHLLDTGSPHYVALKSGLDTIDMNAEGAKIRNSNPFSATGINVNFAEKMDDATFSVRTYERGVEAETLSCGTGVTAVAIAMFHSNQTASTSIKLETQGGVLQVRFEPLPSLYSEVWLCGPTKQVFKAELEW
ncbi:diaminopimelate epimerase [Flavobacteriaceae bacterium]|jgi:diaminopimelate epimerase|nr:diaminopimelate epimerase [Flavobacteriaceae bacterium]MDC1195494.1 diaminopimelate epimerase [Flavobacteriaceae bacterium]MDG1384093.1 diaminopimelate epimerase [Flavobacteriaceae bacterium]